MKRFFLFLISLVLSFNLWGQKGFFANDSLMTVGVNITDGGDIRNSQICRVNYGDRIVDYTPGQISEYGFDDRLYFAKDILIDGSIKRVFLERIVEGGKSLYYYRARGITLFFVNVGDGFLLRLPKVDEESRKKFTEVLAEITSDCLHTIDFLRLVAYNKRSMTEFFEKYNECRPSPFRRNKLGISMSYGLSKLSPVEDFVGIEVLDLFGYDYIGGISFGFFYEIPLLFQGFNLHLGVNLSQISQSSREEALIFWNVSTHSPQATNVTFSLQTKSQFIELPIMVKYYQFTGKRFSPFINAGGHLGFSFNETKINQRYNGEDHLFPYTTPSSQILAGYNIGLGLEIMINPRNSIFFETRLNQMFSLGVSRVDIMFNNASYRFLTGFKF